MLSALSPQTYSNKEPSFSTMDRSLRTKNGGWAPSADPASFAMQQNPVSAAPSMSTGTDAFEPISPCRPTFESHRATVVSPMVAPVKEEARNFDVMFQETLLDLMKDEQLDNKEIDDIQVSPNQSSRCYFSWKWHHVCVLTAHTSVQSVVGWSRGRTARPTSHCVVMHTFLVAAY